LQDFHRFDLFKGSIFAYFGNEMTMRHTLKVHEHVAKRVHVLIQRAGVPYEIEQQVCTSCARILDEKPVKRAAA
jgi:NMD protein affecting ribosome stability and mRNA decay